MTPAEPAGVPKVRDLFAALNTLGAQYLVVGGYALAQHGHPRLTRDLEVWVRADPENARKVWKALDAFGAGLGYHAVEDLETPDIVFQISLPPDRVVVLTGIDGVAFEDAWAHQVQGRYGDQPVRVIGVQDLIRNKLATGRPQDSLDAKTLLRHA
jgi:hypothetical protein